MLIDRAHRRRILLLSSLSAAGAAVSAVSALANAGLYRDVMPAEMVAGALGFDAMAMAVAVAIGWCVHALRAKRERYWLIWIGLQGYLLYAYALYAFDYVSTPLYLMYIAILGLSAYALALFARALNVRVLRDWHPGPLPRNAMAGTLFTIAGMFAAAWIWMVLDSIVRRADLPPSTVIVLDLAFTLPLLATVGAMLARHRPMGDLLAPGVFALAATITLGVAAGELLRPAYGGPFTPAFAAPYLLPGMVCLAFSLFAFNRVGRAFPGSRATQA